MLKSYGPTKAFTQKSALQLIGKEDPDRPGELGAQFSDYENLYIERRQHGTKLTSKDVFTHLVDKGLFRIGAELTCPNCGMTSWISLDSLKQKVVSELCGQEPIQHASWSPANGGIVGPG